MRKASLADRGKYAEGKMHDFLRDVSANVAEFDFERIPDARTARGRIGKRAGDFVWFRPNHHGVVEVKEVEHDFRLPSKNVTQLPAMHKRRLAGGTNIILVFHRTTELWRNVPFEWLWTRRAQSSWDLTEFTTFQKLTDINLYQILSGKLPK